MTKLVKQYKKLKMIMKQNDKMIRRGQKALKKWNNPYTIEQYQQAVAYGYNPTTKNLDIFF